ncbi:MAG: nickel-type superoxide dismutase maturation protease [Acidimicrobiales bacterium]
MLAGSALTAAAAVAGLGIAASRRYTRLRITGFSMVPELVPGDRVLVDRHARIAVGDVVALHDPREERRCIVKRVVGIESHGLRVEGDNSDESTDSRHFGPVPGALVIGRVVRRYGH